MRVLISFTLICVLAGSAMAQRGGGGGGGRGGGMGGGSHGGGNRGGGMGGGGHRGGFGGGAGFGRGGGFHHGGGYIGGFRGFGYSYGPYYGGLGFGASWGPSYSSYITPYSSYISPQYDYGYYGGGYASYTPNITVIYPPQQPVTLYVEPDRPARPVTREYDQYGQEVKREASTAPLYLFAFRNKVITAATAYWVEGKTLHYVTYDNEQKQAPLDTLDRELTMRLNSERRIEIQLPQQ